MFYIINNFGFIYTQKTCNCIYILYKIAIYNVNGKVNLNIDLKNLILINIYLISCLNF